MLQLMKKVFLAGVLVCWVGFAQAYTLGDVVLSGGVVASPVGLGSDWGEVNVEDRTLGITHDSKLGEPGVGVDVQAFYFVHPRVAIGLEFSHQLFIKERSSGWYLDGLTRQEQYLLALRIFINPEDNYKVYLAMGAGVLKRR